LAIEKLLNSAAELGMTRDELPTDDGFAYIFENIPSDPDDLAAICDRVLDRWIKLWKKVGGLKQFLPTTA
jgi:hypothetical protein